MFCMKCGKPTEDGQRMCPACAAAYAAPQAAPQEFAPQQDAFQLNTGAPAPKKKKKGGLIAAIIAAVVLVGSGIGLWLGWDSLFGGKEEAVKVYNTPVEHMVGVEQDAWNEAAEFISDAYGSFRDTAGTTTMNSATTEAHILVGEDVLALAQTALIYSDLDMELDWLSDVMLVISVAQDGDVLQYDIAVGLGNKKIATVRCMLNMETSMLYMGVPELSDTYMEMDLSQQMGGMTIKDMLAEYQGKLGEITAVLPSEEDVQALLIKYIGVILTQITEVEKETVTITVADKSQEVVKLTTTITEEDLMDIFIKVLETAKEDTKLHSIIEKMASLDSEFYTEGEPTEEFKADIEAYLAELQELKQDSLAENYLVLTTYADNRHNIVGRSMTVSSVDEGIMNFFDYKKATVGNDFAFEAVIADGTVKVTGSGTEVGGVLNGTYALKVEGIEYLTLKVTDMTTGDDGVTGGTFLLTPSQDLVDMFLDNTDIPAYLVDSIAIELKFSASEAATNFEVRLLTDAETLLGLTLATRLEENKALSLPGSTVSVEDEEDGMEWLSSLDYQAVIQNMKDAGVPSTLTDMLESYLPY